MAQKILIVDDSEINREMLAEILGDEYVPIQLDNGAAAIDYMMKGTGDIAAVMLDLVMPEVSGYDVIKFMSGKKLMNRVPVLVISAERSPEAEKYCMDMGVSDFIRKPFNSGVVKLRVRNIVQLFLYKQHLEEQVAMQTQQLMLQNEQLRKQEERARRNNDRIIDILGSVVEYRNLESGEHIRRVKGFTKIIAEDCAEYFPEYGLTPEKIEVIVAASALHDIGKIAISDQVLLKPGKLTHDEFLYMRTHTLRGCEIIERIRGAWDEDYKQTCFDICRSHHERYDGKGYPDGLKGDEIPISAQLVSVADVYDALISPRVYKAAYDRNTAFLMIMRGGCGNFNPKLKQSLQRSKAKMEALADRFEKEKRSF